LKLQAGNGNIQKLRVENVKKESRTSMMPPTSTPLFMKAYGSERVPPPMMVQIRLKIA
jgi:hypothetical protein